MDSASFDRNTNKHAAVHGAEIRHKDERSHFQYWLEDGDIEEAVGGRRERRKPSSEEGKRSRRSLEGRGCPVRTTEPGPTGPSSTIPLPSSIKSLFLPPPPPAAPLPWSVPDSLALPTQRKTVKLFWQERELAGGHGGSGSRFGPCSTLWASLESVSMDTAQLEHLFESCAKDVLPSKASDH